MIEERYLTWCRERRDEARWFLTLIDQRGFRLENLAAAETPRDATADLAEHLSRTINQLTAIINEASAR
ncbi:MAG: hypothetical protein GC155_07250 [Alphaproteobacteria bacterium]|nr:hypothetical protein [Alphaproteobacteria bacterium]